MRILTTGDLVKDQIHFSSLFAQPVSAQSVKEFERDGKRQIKTAPDGRAVYSTSLKALRLVDGIPVGEERGVSLAVIEPVDISAGKSYRLKGQVWITPYERDGRVALSIIAESVETVSAAPLGKVNFGGSNNA